MLRTQLLATESQVKESPDKTKSAARDHLSGALKEAIKKEDDDISDLDLLPTPIKNLMSSGLSPFSSPVKSARKRKRKSLDKATGYHHTFIMKLFDRAVDLGPPHPMSAVTPVTPCTLWPRPGSTTSPLTSITKLPPPLPLAEDVRTLRVPRLEATPPSVLDLGNYHTIYFSSFVPSEDLAAITKILMTG